MEYASEDDDVSAYLSAAEGIADANLEMFHPPASFSHSRLLTLYCKQTTQPTPNNAASPNPPTARSHSCKNTPPRTLGIRNQPLEIQLRGE
jgi:hypothetical protein